MRGQYIDMRMLSYEFVILEVNGANIEFALDDIYYNGVPELSVEDIQTKTVQDFQLYDNSNPFNPSTTISYNLSNSTNVKIEIYNTVQIRSTSCNYHIKIQLYQILLMSKLKFITQFVILDKEY